MRPVMSTWISTMLETIPSQKNVKKANKRDALLDSV
jgi:hypothetical protein